MSGNRVPASLRVRPGSMVTFEGETWQVWARAEQNSSWWLATGGIYKLAHTRELAPAHLTERLHTDHDAGLDLS